ncbi:MAG: glycoside hydrolase family 127 protein [Sedimentisphaerales bacterium]|nr:glycoside hydrolase family 127 protein [Sedimentisphaerales bacterium]
MYFHSDTDLWVNLFIASELDWKAKGLNLRQETTFPEAGASKLKFSLKKDLKLNLNDPYIVMRRAYIQYRDKQGQK